MFLLRSRMELAPADPESLALTIRLALTLDHRGRPKKFRAPANDAELTIAVERVIEALRRGNYVVMQGQVGTMHGMPGPQRLY